MQTFHGEFADESTRHPLLIMKIKKALDEYSRENYKEKIEKLEKIFESLNPVTQINFSNIDIGSALFPCETVKRYPVPSRITSISDIVNYFSKENIAIGALDSSFYNAGPHIMVPLTVVSVGCWCYNYSSEVCKSIFIADAKVETYDQAKLQFYVKEIEMKAVRECLTKILDGKHKFILFDESFSLAYTLSWAKTIREEYARKVKEIIDFCISNDIIPVGLFYTRAMDIIRGIKLEAKEDSDIFPISDRRFMNYYLENAGDRSPTFIVYSKAIYDIGLHVRAFYLKLSENNVIRVEFPECYINKKDLIHLVVYGQAILGGGYPFALQRVHEIAALKKEDRKIIEDTIAEYLKKPNIEYILSRKVFSKRWPFA